MKKDKIISELFPLNEFEQNKNLFSKFIILAAIIKIKN